MASTMQIPFEVYQNSVLFTGKVNDQDVQFILDTGDAVGPVFNSADAQRLNLQPEGQEGVEGAGGASSLYTTQATVQLDVIAWDNEPCAIDPSLTGPSLLGLPFFLKKTDQLALDFTVRVLAIANADTTGHHVS